GGGGGRGGGGARGAAARPPPQHGINETGKSGGAAIGLHQLDGKVDGSMIGYIEKKNLRRANEQRAFDSGRLRRQTAIKEQPNKMAQRAEAPQHRGNQNTHQGAVARCKSYEFAAGIE